MPNIAFLHTSPVHVTTFDGLLRELAPDSRGVHIVREDLLAEAQVEGIDSPGLIARVRAALADAAASGAPVVVCTCSTLGGIAESFDGEAPFRVTRIDRAMADHAARAGGTVLLVAALESTLGPTSALLASSCKRLNATIAVRQLLVQDAWTHFQAGAIAAYLDTIVAAVIPLAPQVDTIMLAQASMAPAAAQLTRLGTRVLSSPRLGVEHALSLAAAR